MDDFSTTEARLSHMPVRLLDYEGAGVLRLSGRSSSLVVSSEQLLWPERDENGWYDIRLRDGDRREVLVHHAVTARSSELWTDNNESRAYSTTIFPNIVVEDLRGLSDSRTLRTIHFRLRGFGSFFYYQHTESLRMHGAAPEQIEALRALRYPSRGDVFAPTDVYVLHRYPEFCSFEVEDRTYRVWAEGRSTGGAWHRIDARMYPVAGIEFAEPVDLDTALDRVWEWRRFFSQMSMMPLAFRAMAVKATLDPDAHRANLYLANLKKPAKETGRYALSPAYLPLNMWEDREALAQAMRGWLTRATDRRTFRARLDRVIERMNRRIDPGDLVTLGAAIDALGELSSRSALSPGVLDLMVHAAHGAAREGNVDIDPSRIRGVLGSLQRPSLSDRMQTLGAGLAPAILNEDAGLVARSAIQIRNASAHGGALSAQLQPLVSPAVRALAALCAYYDLHSSGVPARTRTDARSMPLIRFADAIEELRRLDPQLPAR